MGPRTFKRRLAFLAKHDTHPRAQFARWVHECGLDPWDESAQDYDLAVKMFELGLCYDRELPREQGRITQHPRQRVATVVPAAGSLAAEAAGSLGEEERGGNERQAGAAGVRGRGAR